MEMLLLLAGLVGLSVFGDNSDSSEPRNPTTDPTDENPPLPVTPDLTVTGTGMEDTVRGDAGNDLIRGLDGDDEISGHAGDDTLYGGEGNDIFSWNEGEDVLFGGAGDDAIWETGVPVYTGLVAGPNISNIDGGSGDDSIGFDGGSTVTGGAGADMLSLFHNQQEDAASIITDFDPAQDSLAVYLEGVDTSAGSTMRLQDWDDGQGADLFYGDELLARINGAQGMDPATIDLRVTLAENGEEISFTDGDGNTTIFGNYADNTISGAGGNDMIVVGNTPAFVGTAPQDGVDAAYGGAGDDTLGGSGGQFETFFSGDGDSGPVTETREQTISRDSLFGGDGDDFLLSENGNDLTGGAGEDVFAVSHLAGEDAVGFTLDPTVITDYDPASDEIVITNDSVAPGSALSISVWENGLGSDIMMGTAVIAQVTGGQALTVGDIRMENHLIEAYVNA